MPRKKLQAQYHRQSVHRQGWSTQSTYSNLTLRKTLTWSITCANWRSPIEDTVRTKTIMRWCPACILDFMNISPRTCATSERTSKEIRSHSPGSNSLILSTWEIWLTVPCWIWISSSQVASLIGGNRLREEVISIPARAPGKPQPGTVATHYCRHACGRLTRSQVKATVPCRDGPGARQFYPIRQAIKLDRHRSSDTLEEGQRDTRQLPEVFFFWPFAALIVTTVAVLLIPTKSW